MTVQWLRADERTAAPWKNGGGVTREIAASPAGAGLADFDWRVSLADVEASGPFSAFPGVDRIITLVEGPGMVLTVAGTPRRVDQPYEPLPFPGDTMAECVLIGGPIIDFNVMTRRGGTTARVDLVQDTREVTAPRDGTVLVVALSGSAALGDGRLDRFDAALLTDGRRCGRTASPP